MFSNKRLSQTFQIRKRFTDFTEKYFLRRFKSKNPQLSARDKHTQTSISFSPVIVVGMRNQEDNTQYNISKLVRIALKIHSRTNGSKVYIIDRGNLIEMDSFTNQRLIFPVHEMDESSVDNPTAVNEYATKKDNIETALPDNASSNEYPGTEPSVVDCSVEVDGDAQIYRRPKIIPRTSGKLHLVTGYIFLIKFVAEDLYCSMMSSYVFTQNLLPILKRIRTFSWMGDNIVFFSQN